MVQSNDHGPLAQAFWTLIYSMTSTPYPNRPALHPCGLPLRFDMSAGMDHGGGGTLMNPATDSGTPLAPVLSISYPQSHSLDYLLHPHITHYLDPLHIHLMPFFVRSSFCCMHASLTQLPCSYTVYLFIYLEYLPQTLSYQLFNSLYCLFCRFTWVLGWFICLNSGKYCKYLARQIYLAIEFSPDPNKTHLNKLTQGVYAMLCRSIGI